MYIILQSDLLLKFLHLERFLFNLFWKLFLSSIQFWLTFSPFNTLEILLFCFLSCPVLTWNVWLFIPYKWCIFFPLRLLFSEFFLCLFKSNLILICLGIVFLTVAFETYLASLDLWIMLLFNLKKYLTITCSCIFVLSSPPTSSGALN